MICPSFEEVMELTRTVSSHTAFSENECRAYYDLAAALTPRSLIVEVGLQFGRSSSIVAQVAKARCHNYIGVDPFIEPPEAATQWLALMQRIGCDVTLMMKPSATIDYENLRADLILVDGDHEADAVATDCQIVTDVLTPGGHVCFHDYGNPGLPGVTPTVDRWMSAPKFQHVGVVDTLAIWRRK